MSALFAQQILVAAFAIALLVLVIALVRSGVLAVRYGIGWAGGAIVVFLLAPLLGLAPTLAREIGFSPTGLLLFVAFTALVLVALQLSVALSRANEHVRTLSEELALFERRVSRSEQAGGAPTNAPANPSAKPMRDHVPQDLPE